MFEKLNTEYMRANQASERNVFQPVKHIDAALKNTTPAAARFLDHKHQEEKRHADSRRARELERNGKKERERARARARARKEESEYRRGVKGETEKKRKRTIVALQG